MTDVPATKVLQAGLWEETALESGISEDYLGTELKIKKKKNADPNKTKIFSRRRSFQMFRQAKPDVQSILTIFTNSICF